ncbi:hypothetical protein LINPERPRIM_LOCUS28258, partial [Linum perenne]
DKISFFNSSITTKDNKSQHSRSQDSRLFLSHRWQIPPFPQFESRSIHKHVQSHLQLRPLARSHPLSNSCKSW